MAQDGPNMTAQQQTLSPARFVARGDSRASWRGTPAGRGTERHAVTRIARPSWYSVLLAMIIAFGAPLGCGGKRQETAPAPARADFVGVWRVVFDSPGGELPVTVEIFENPGPDDPPAVFRNGEQTLPFTEVTISGRRINLRVDHLDAAITAELEASGERLVGIWQVLEQQGPATLPVVAYKGQTHRFSRQVGDISGDAQAVPSVNGTWRLDFRSEDADLGVAELNQEGEVVTGTIIHSQGALRYLTGTYDNGVLRLSAFSGGLAALVRAHARQDGTLSGEVWWNNQGYRGFTATASTPAKARAHMPDPARTVRVRNPDKSVSFRFPDLEGKLVSQDAPRFAGKVVLVELFGSWCANCNAAAPQLVAWYERYRERGLEIVGLAYEHTGEPERDRRQVRLFAEHHGIEFPLLLAGTSDARTLLKGVSSVSAFPTMLLIGRDGLVRKVHAGFLGPSAGVHHERQIAQLEADIEALLED